MDINTVFSYRFVRAPKPRHIVDVFFWRKEIFFIVLPYFLINILTWDFFFGWNFSTIVLVFFGTHIWFFIRLGTVRVITYFYRVIGVEVYLYYLERILTGVEAGSYQCAFVVFCSDLEFCQWLLWFLLSAGCLHSFSKKFLLIFE